MRAPPLPGAALAGAAAAGTMLLLPLKMLLQEQP
jgi:hypothetical protein